MAKANDPLAALSETATAQENATIRKERDALQERVAKMGEELEVLRKIANDKPRRDYAPDAEAMTRIWELAYQEALRSIFSKGLGYWNMKAAVLQQELTLAVVRADEALEGYIQTRKTLADPAITEIQRFERERNTNPLVSK